MGGPRAEEIGMRLLGVEDELFEIRDGSGMNEQVRGQDGDILIIQGAIIIIRVAWEVVRFIWGARLIDKLEIEFRHSREIAHNATANFLGMAVVL
jgi:hypothetical protein